MIWFATGEDEEEQKTVQKLASRQQMLPPSAAEKIMAYRYSGICYGQSQRTG